MIVESYPANPFRFGEVSEPLNGNLVFVDGAEGVLPDDFVTKVERCLTFDDPALVPINARGRSYFLPLPSAFGPYDSLQISGGGYVDDGIRSMRGDPSQMWPSKFSDIVEPPRRATTPFEAAGTSYIDDNGEVKIDYTTGILGGYFSRQAEGKVRKTHGAWRDLIGSEDELIVPRVIGRFVYDLPDGEGSSQSAVLTLVPNNGLRFDHLLRESDQRLLALYLDGQDVTPLIQQEYRTELPAMIRAIGYGIAKVHDLGYSHNQTHVGNLGVVAGNDNTTPFIADWDTSRKPAEDIRLLAQTGDLAQVIKSQIIRVLNLLNTGGLRSGAHWGPVKSIANNTIRGYADYFGHPNPDDLKLKAPEMLEHLLGVHSPREMLKFFNKAVIEARSSAK